ncbi:MAG: hypothetical protein L6Q47_05740 [Ignavibacteriaceae bacterium]|nr:hypothetical protein [Ignavibacteriaceae bacterium]
MKLVTKDHLARWADTFFSKGGLSYLISRLIRAITPASTKLNLPSGSASYIGGWDGIVNCETETAYVPQGISLWELGTSYDVKGKADQDYNKRKTNPIEHTPSDSTFIFVTPRIWIKKDEWIAAKKAENHWRDVKVYDAIDLEQWLDIALAVSRWFASQEGVGSYPFDGIMTTEEFWEEWSIIPGRIVLSPESVTTGRQYEKTLLLKALEGPPTIKGVKASTKDEAIAFILASALTFPPEESDRFLSKTLIIDTEANFRGIRNNAILPLNLIPRIDNAQPLYAAVSRGHHVIVPLGADDNFNQDTITLSTIDRDGQIKSLIESGLSREDAEKYSRESGRNITILKKLLGFPSFKAKWIIKENIREIIPAIILGRWDENFVGDIELVEKLSEQRYSDYIGTLTKWKNFEESPIIQIGRTWRLTSPLDIWTNLSTHLTTKDFQSIQDCFFMAFNNKNTIIEHEDKTTLSVFDTKKKKYSSWSREGLAQSLILITRLKEVKIQNHITPQDWVDTIIFDLLNNSNGEMWISVNQELPLLSEASPDSFLKAVKNSLNNKQPEIMDMFIEEEGILHKTSNHTGLLWALEGLAWLPEYLREVSLILLRLSRLDPGGSISNRPLSSISEIFKPWRYQTLASFEDRIEILKSVTQIEKESGWNLLLGMLPEPNQIAMPTHKMRWRMFDQNTNLTHTRKEVWETHSAVIELLINLFDNDEEKFAQLIKKAVNLNPDLREKILVWAEEVYPNILQKKYTAWKTIREILSRHRSYSGANWALPESELVQFEKLYYKIQPEDIVNKYSWLFNTQWPQLPESYKYEDNEHGEWYEKRQKHIDDERKTAVKQFVEELGLKTTLELRTQVKEPWLLGGALANEVINQDDILTVCSCLYDEKSLLGFVHNFIYRKSIAENFDWIKALFNKLQENEFSNRALSNILVPLDPNQRLWDFVDSLNEEIQKEYWQNVNPYYYGTTDSEKIIGIENLLKYKRYFSAIDIASHFPKVIPSNILAEMLIKAATEEASEPLKLAGYEIAEVFKELNNRTDVEKETLIHLEWLYLAILTPYKEGGGVKYLEEELANNPEFFVEVLKCIYRPKDETIAEKERARIPDVEYKNRAEQAFRLLYAWKKIPGMKEDNTIDEAVLRGWIDKARILAEKASRLHNADVEIGRILAKDPEDVMQWPQEIILQIIEELNTDELKSGYSAEMYNKRGFSTRGAFEGGDIEREKAAYFEKLANDFKYKYPSVAEIFKQMQIGYLAEAKTRDEEAERRKLEY